MDIMYGVCQCMHRMCLLPSIWDRCACQILKKQNVTHGAGFVEAGSPGIRSLQSLHTFVSTPPVARQPQPVLFCAVSTRCRADWELFTAGRMLSIPRGHMIGKYHNIFQIIKCFPSRHAPHETHQNYNANGGIRVQNRCASPFFVHM
jgi:hypothetical protein